ncbi:MAG: DUF1846 domain-containing protein [Faecalicoccus sp.]|nr:DUF1846 domain-containing protein [Faecalicoccus sp.]
MKIGFDNNKYLRLQSENIMQRISHFGDKLYLEFGGKLFDDFHASRVLPGFAPDSKMQMLMQIKDSAEIVIAISASDIEQNKIRADLGISYQDDVIRLINEFRNVGLLVSSVVITQFDGQKAVAAFKTRLKRRKIAVYYHYLIEGYPTNPKKIISESGFGRNDYVKTTKPLVVITAPGPGSGKMATCLSQLYHDNLHGIKAGYAKYETFPIWNLPLDHPVNLAYEAATADLADVNMIDPYHLQAYNTVTVNYNRDVEIFPVLKNIFEEIYGSSPYQSPTDMGVNMAGKCIIDDDVCREAAMQEIIRRYFFSKTRYLNEKCTYDEVQKQELVMRQAGITEETRRCVVAARAKEEATGTVAGALELEDGTLIDGKTSRFMGACSSVLMNAVKHLANIDPEINLIKPEAFGPIQKLKTDYLGSKNPRLHSNEILIALSLSAQTNENAALALEQLKNLSGLQAHITSSVSDVDKNTYKSLGIQMTYDAEKR